MDGPSLQPLGNFGVALDQLPHSMSLHELVAEHQLVRIGGLDSTPQQVLALATQLGEVRPSEFLADEDTFPGVARIVHEPESGRAVFGGAWHSDLSFLDPNPRFGVLLGVDSPAQGGATLFASQRLALARLSRNTVRYFESLSCTLSGRHIFGREGSYSDPDTRPAGVPDSSSRSTQDISRSLVVRDAGYSVLAFDPGYTTAIGTLSEAESFHVWRWLDAIATDWNVVTQVSVQPGQAVIWSNRSVLHRAPDHHVGRRVVLRASVW